MDTKTCTDCLLEKPLNDFATRSSKCKPCHRIYNRAHYQANKAAYKTKARRNDAIYLSMSREYIWNYLTSHPCVNCGESDPVVLEFDHDDPSVKITEVTKLIKFASLEKLKTEVEKCTVRCANCHRRKTATQFGWWRATYIRA